MLRKLFSESVYRKIKSMRLQIVLLYKKRKKIFKDLLIKVCMLYAYMGYKTGAKYYGWDDISEISAKGKRGKLATAISYLPREGGLKGLFTEWLQDLKLIPITSEVENVRDVNGRISHFCCKCGKRTMKTFGNYHTMRCSNCKVILNRHSNSSSYGSQLVQVDVETMLSTLTPHVNVNSIDFSDYG